MITTKTKTVQVHECSICGKPHKELEKAEACFRKCYSDQSRKNKKQEIITSSIAALERAETIQEIQEIVNVAHLSYFGDELNLKIERAGWNTDPSRYSSHYPARNGKKEGLVIQLRISYNKKAFGTGNNIFENLGVHTGGGTPDRMSAHIWLDDFPAIKAQWETALTNSLKISEQYEVVCEEMRAAVDADSEINGKQLVVDDLVEQARVLMARAQKIQSEIFVVGNKYREQAESKFEEFRNNLPVTPMFRLNNMPIYNYVSRQIGAVEPDEE